MALRRGLPARPAVGGWGGVGFLINEVSLRQTIVAPGLMGRVNSSAEFLRSIARLAGVLVAGLAGEIIGLRATLGLGGAVVILGAIFLAFTSLRSLKTMPASADDRPEIFPDGSADPSRLLRRNSRSCGAPRDRPVAFPQDECYHSCWNPNRVMKDTDVRQGTLALMVLKTLDVLGPLHGYGIARRIEQISGDLLTVNQGTLYPVLLKLEQEGSIASEWGASENNRKARFYG